MAQEATRQGAWEICGAGRTRPAAAEDILADLQPMNMKINVYCGKAPKLGGCYKKLKQNKTRKLALTERNTKPKEIPG